MNYIHSQTDTFLTTFTHSQISFPTVFTMRGSCTSTSVWCPAVVVIACLTLMGMVPEVASTRYIVGGNKGWSPGNNYTIWAQDKHFHTDDWLFFVYDRNQQDILEVNKTDYEACISDHPVHNWTTGVGRDVVPLNVTRHYYFLSGKGFCFSGMKLAVHVEKAPPPPSFSPIKSDSSRFTVRGQFVIAAVIAIGAVWDSFLRVW